MALPFGVLGAITRKSRLPWFVLSALHGLVGPDDPLATYDLALKDVPAARRRDWARRVVIELERRFGSLESVVVEMHAGSIYRNVLTPLLVNCGALVESPTAAIPGVGNQLAWYATAALAPRRLRTAQPGREGRVISPPSLALADVDVINRQRPATSEEVAAALDALDRDPLIVSASAWSSGLAGLDRPGLYSWWVDAQGAEMLSRGLGHAVVPGRIYAGLTGATKWPSGKTVKNTLRN